LIKKLLTNKLLGEGGVFILYNEKYISSANSENIQNYIDW